MEIIILTESELRQCIGMDQEANAVVADGFTRLANSEVTLPPILPVDIPENKG